MRFHYDIRGRTALDEDISGVLAVVPDLDAVVEASEDVLVIWGEDDTLSRFGVGWTSANKFAFV